MLSYLLVKNCFNFNLCLLSQRTSILRKVIPVKQSHHLPHQQYRNSAPSIIQTIHKEHTLIALDSFHLRIRTSEIANPPSQTNTPEPILTVFIARRQNEARIRVCTSLLRHLSSCIIKAAFQRKA